jgi:glycosyltransferase involved in cell wall biosynthesis
VVFDACREDPSIESRDHLKPAEVRTVPTAPPFVSVVVPTHNRAHLLGRLVEALEGNGAHVALELIVVDDASTDDTWTELRRLASMARIPLVPVRLETNSGPAAARNAGWRRARADLVAFTDDDCVPQPGWLQALLGRLGEADMVQGRTVGDPAKTEGRGPFSRTQWVHSEAGFYETCNMVYRRKLLEDLGGFDEGFRRPYGEDTDLAWRAKERGARSAFEAEALVYHEVSPSRYLDYLRDKRRRAGMARVVRRHGGIRRALYKRWFLPNHPPALLAAGGLGLVAGRPSSARRWAMAAVLAGPYVRYRLVSDRLPCRRRNLVPVIALALVADLAEVGVLAVASAMNRTLIL